MIAHEGPYLSALPADKSASYRLESYRKMKNFLEQLKKMAHGKNITGTNIQIAAENYLMNDVKLSQDEIIALKNVLNRNA